MSTLLFHPEIGDDPGSGLIFILLLAGYVLGGALILYFVVRLIRAFLSGGKKP